MLKPIITIFVICAILSLGIAPTQVSAQTPTNSLETNQPTGEKISNPELKEMFAREIEKSKSAEIKPDV